MASNSGQASGKAGPTPIGLWIDADQASFLAKWNEWAAQNLRLVSIRNYDGLWAASAHRDRRLWPLDRRRRVELLASGAGGPAKTFASSIS